MRSNLASTFSLRPEIIGVRFHFRDLLLHLAVMFVRFGKNTCVQTGRRYMLEICLTVDQKMFHPKTLRATLLETIRR